MFQGIAFLLLKLKQMQAVPHNCKKPYTDSKTGLIGADCSDKAILNSLIPDDLGDISVNIHFFTYLSTLYNMDFKIMKSM